MEAMASVEVDKLEKEEEVSFGGEGPEFFF